MALTQFMGQVDNPSNLSFRALVKSAYEAQTVVKSHPYAVCGALTSLTLNHNSLAASSHLLIAATPSKCLSQSEKYPFTEKDSGISKGRVVIVTALV